MKNVKNIIEANHLVEHISYLFKKRFELEQKRK